MIVSASRMRAGMISYKDIERQKMIIREIAKNVLIVVLFFYVISVILYLRLTISEITKERKGKIDVLTSVRWITYCFLSSLFFLLVVPILFVIDVFSHTILKDLSEFFILCLLHILFTFIFLFLGTSPGFLIWRQEVCNRIFFRLTEFGYTLYLATIAVVSFLIEIRVSAMYPFNNAKENEWGTVEIAVIMVLLTLGSASAILLIWKHIVRLWEKRSDFRISE